MTVGRCADRAASSGCGNGRYSGGRLCTGRSAGLEVHGNLNSELATGVSAYESDCCCYRMLFLRQNGITPIAEVSRAGEFLFLREFCAVIRMRRAAPAWQHGGMTWRTAGGGTGYMAARAREGAEQSGTPSQRLLAGNFTGFSRPTRYLMALCDFS